MNRKRAGKRRGMGFMTIGLLLLAAAFLLTGYNIWDERRAEKASQELLSQMDLPVEEAKERFADWEAGLQGSEVDIPDYVLNPYMDMPVTVIEGHAYIGVLSVPSLGLDLPVMAEWSYPKLKIAPCRYHGSAYTHDLIIAGHNYRKHFSPIKNLEPGERIVFTDVEGNQFFYQVDTVEILKKTAVEQMESGEWDLTLFTCTYGGQTRFTLRCILEEDS
ncbi:MAG: sortase [Lachnospiraceae bacterium]|nr:sortase [Lachnospiraceae bacterium]